MKVGYCFDGMAPVPEMVALAREAEAAGVESLWLAEHLCFRDAFAPAMACLAVTARVTVAPAAVTPYTRHPIIAAMTAATLAEFAPGRVILAVATGNPVALGECGLVPERPLSAVRQFAAIVRALWRGEAVTSDGAAFRMRGARLGFTPPAPIPLYVAAMRPRMLELAGEIGDGVLLSGGISPAFIRRSVEQVRGGAQRVGRPPAELQVAGFIVTSVHPDEGEALRASREFLAYLFRSRAFTENLEFTGTPLDQAELAAH
ncbi:MAG: LLM class flavin-dependent oxidoreductase, partial [Deltaproteobacteria bacterium]|nr:LLM class flavin-dependent oxidoreductase [Deltaproteobacteria bacterium]